MLVGLEVVCCFSLEIEDTEASKTSLLVAEVGGVYGVDLGFIDTGSGDQLI